MLGNNNNRGVTLPSSQLSPRGEGKPNTLINAARCEWVGVEFYDEQGAKQQLTLLKIGDEYRMPPNSSDWTAKLRGIPKWLSDGIKGVVSSGNPAEPPKEDNVDVLGSGDEVQKTTQ